jgi:hypothetical protein
MVTPWRAGFAIYAACVLPWAVKVHGVVCPFYAEKVTVKVQTVWRKSDETEFVE